jgi:hypothetical protein
MRLSMHRRLAEHEIPPATTESTNSRKIPLASAQRGRIRDDKSFWFELKAKS